MKKVVRILGFCALMAFAFTACKKNSDGKVVIKASMPETTSNSKTYLDIDWVKWSNFDEILVCDLQSTEGEDHVWLEVEGGQHTNTATFYGNPDFFAHLETDDKSYTAFYPIVSDALIGDDSVTLVIPTVQSFEKNSFATNTYPMYAFNKANNFRFNSPAGLLTIPIKANGSGIKISRIDLSAEAGDNPLVGNLIYKKDLHDGTDTDTIPDYTISNPWLSVSLQCPGTGYSFTNGETVYFNIILMEGALQGVHKFTVTLYGQGGGFLGLFLGQIENNSVGIVRETRVMMETINLPL